MSQENREGQPVAGGTAQLLSSLSAEVKPVRKAIFMALRAGEVPTPDDIAARSGLAVDDVQQHLAALETMGIALRDDSGRIVAADGLSTTPTRHRLVLDGVPLHTWCAIDAIGIPGALEADATAMTTCPSCGTELEVVFRRGAPDAAAGLVAWAPSKACSNVMQDFCPEANLFCNGEHLEAWRADHDEPAGHTLSVPSVIEQGQRVWAQLDENSGRRGAT